MFFYLLVAISRRSQGFGIKMDRDKIQSTVLQALAGVQHPSTCRNIVDSGHVQSIEVMENGDVRFSFIPGDKDTGDLIGKAREAVEAIDGIGNVKINIKLPQAANQDLGREAPSNVLQPGSVPAPTPKPGILSDVSHVVAVSSGKGGVGKSMVATNLAAALSIAGKSVGLLDADIYGPNIPLMFGEGRRPSVTGNKGEEFIEPLKSHGVHLMSLGFLLDKEQPAIMRGPLISGILKQFLEQVNWGTLDVMIVDMPPGTGDAQLSLVQTINIDGVVMVSTPQDVSTGDVRRGIKMFERVNTPILGIVENMIDLKCPHCDQEIDVFGSGGGKRLADDMDLPILGRIPLDPAVRAAGDEGTPTVVSSPNSPAGEALRKISEVVSDKLSEKSRV